MKNFLKITVLGDIMQGSNNKNFKNLFDDSDYVIANLETPISKDDNDIKNDKYRFTEKIEFARYLKDNGIDFVSTANNHCLDNGVDGIDKTLNCLDEVGIEHTGTYRRDDPKIFIKTFDNGTRLGIISYTYGTNAFYNNIYLSDEEKYKVNLTQEQELSNRHIRKFATSKNRFIGKIRAALGYLHICQFNKPIYERNEKTRFSHLIEDIKKASNKCDYLLLMLHEGGQYNKKPIKRVIKEVEKLCQTNLDAIICNHEHVIHDFFVKNNKMITYAIGNFISPNSGDCSIGINIYIYNDKTTKYTYNRYKNMKQIDKEKNVRNA